MKDIDFDELDRAVSSVLGQKVSTGQADKTTDTVSSASSSDGKVSVSTGSNSSKKPVPQTSPEETHFEPAPASKLENSEKPRVATPLAVSRRGRFMDVMHPTTSSVSGPASPSSPHVATKLEPLSSKESFATATADEAPAPVAEQPSEPIADLDETHALIGAEPTLVSEELSPTTPATVPLPDDKEHPGSHLLEATYDDTESVEKPDDKKDDTAPVTDEVKADDEKVSDAEEPTPASSLLNTVPQTTPFLSDTKVDKRPLGGVAPTDPTDPSLGLTPAPDVQSSPEVPLPRELQPDVVQVESLQEDDEEATGPGSKPFATNVEAAPDPQDDGRVEGHPLFDTSTYHEPIAPVAGRGSIPGWAKWLLGLAACLAVGAGVGYFLFTAGL